MEPLTRQYGVPLNARIPTGSPSFLTDHRHTITLEERRREAHWPDRASLELETVLLRLGRAHRMGQRLSATERAHLATFASLRSTMLDRYPEAWNVRDLAAAHVSAARFSVLYACFFKVSPTEELIQQRIKQACGMLTYSRDSLEVIATACGFTDAPHFSRMFKQRLGCTPGPYRKMGAPLIPMALDGLNAPQSAFSDAVDHR